MPTIGSLKRPARLIASLQQMELRMDYHCLDPVLLTLDGIRKQTTAVRQEAERSLGCVPPLFVVCHWIDGLCGTFLPPVIIHTIIQKGGDNDSTESIDSAWGVVLNEDG